MVPILKEDPYPRIADIQTVVMMPGAPHPIAIGFNSMDDHLSEETTAGQQGQQRQPGVDKKRVRERSVSLLSSMLLMRTSSLLQYAMSSGDFTAAVRSPRTTGDSLSGSDNAEDEVFELLAGGPAVPPTSTDSSFSSRVSSPIPIPELT